MTEFTASNGIPVIKKKWGYCLTTGTDLGVMTGVSNFQFDALREYFRDERDKELGRWRSGEHPNYTIHKSGNGHYNLVDEQTGFSYRFTEGQVLRDDVRYRVVSEYFDAHPEPKPWKDREPGEVWEVTYLPLGEKERTRAFQVDVFRRFRNAEGVVVSFIDKDIVSARRIWPEGKES